MEIFTLTWVVLKNKGDKMKKSVLGVTCDLVVLASLICNLIGAQNFLTINVLNVLPWWYLFCILLTVLAIWVYSYATVNIRDEKSSKEDTAKFIKQYDGYKLYRTILTPICCALLALNGLGVTLFLYVSLKILFCVFIASAKKYIK